MVEQAVAAERAAIIRIAEEAARPEPGDDEPDFADFAQGHDGGLRWLVERIRARGPVDESRPVQALREIADMIEGCHDAPRNPDSLPQMVLAHARAAIAKAEGGA
jgi:hypothetical protein